MSKAGRESGKGKAFRELKAYITENSGMVWKYSNRPYTIVHLAHCLASGETLHGVGVAKLSTEDMARGVEFSPKMGTDIAIGRAAAQIARKIEAEPKYMVPQAAMMVAAVYCEAHAINTDNAEDTSRSGLDTDGDNRERNTDYVRRAVSAAL